MTESIAILDGNSSSGVTEHSFNRRLPGDIAYVRQRMIEALESFDYVVLSEDPLLAKRDGSFSMNVLDCGLKLLMTFRQAGPVSTTATFNYTIPLSMVTRGDLHTVELEAEALIAVATSRQTSNACLTCGMNNSADSRFCRGCGAPNAATYPAELEVMRLTAGTRAGQQTIVTGFLVLFLILAITVPLILFAKAKGVWVGWILLVLGQIVGWFTLLYGMLRLHRTLNPKGTVQSLSSVHASGTFRPFESAALHPQSARASVTEGTTELLGAQSREPVATAVDRPDLNTGSMN